MSATTALDIINQQVRVYEDAINQGNVEFVAKLYTRNARLLPPEEEIVSGRDAIQSYFQTLVDDRVKEMQSRVLDAQFVGNHTIQSVCKTTTTVQLPDGQRQEFKTKAIILWQEEDGEYRINVDIWNLQ
jgi:uncharacterized protein (TIGR02246 family)